MPLNSTKTVAIISYPAEQQVAVKASLAKVCNAGAREGNSARKEFG
jgi:hypothetical protein